MGIKGQGFRECARTIEIINDQDAVLPVARVKRLGMAFAQHYKTIAALLFRALKLVSVSQQSTHATAG